MKIAKTACAPGYRMSGGFVAFTAQHAVPATRNQRTWLPGNGAVLTVITDVQSLSASSDERSP